MKTLRCLINDIKKYRKYIIYSARVALQAEVTNAYIDGTYQEVYDGFEQNEVGLKHLFKLSRH